MTKNTSGGQPKTGTIGQSQKCSPGKGGYNSPAKPFGMTNGTSNRPGDASPQFGVTGQRLAGGGGGGKKTGYPKDYR